MEWLVYLFLEAQTFCRDKHVPQVSCITQVLECVTDDNKEWCYSEFHTYYEGK